MLEMLTQFEMLAYILAGLLFILALAGLSQQKTANRGNLFGVCGMALALVAVIVVTLAGNAEIAAQTAGLMVVGIAVASGLKAQSIFTYIQKMQLYVSPGIVAVFAFGLINRRGARGLGALALVLSPTLFAAFSFGWPTLHYLHAAAFTLVGTLAAMFALGAFFRMEKPVVFASATRLDMTPSRGALWAGLAVIAATVALYVIFW